MLFNIVLFYILNIHVRSQLVNIYLPLTVSIQNKLLGCENKEIDHTHRKLSNKNKISHSNLKEKHEHNLGQFDNISLVVSGAEWISSGLVFD